MIYIKESSVVYKNGIGITDRLLYPHSYWGNSPLVKLVLYSHIQTSAFNNFLIICAIKLMFANSKQRHNIYNQQLSTYNIYHLTVTNKYSFNVIFTCECPLNV